MFPRGLLFPCIAIRAAAAIRRGLSLWRTSGDTWWGSGVRCDSRCGPGPSSRIAELPSRCSRAHRISMAPHGSAAVSLSRDRYVPDLRSKPRWSRPGKPRRRLSVWCSLALQADMSRVARIRAYDMDLQGVVHAWSRRRVCGSVRRMRRAWWFAPVCDVAARHCHCYHQPTIIRQCGPAARVADR
jgi:hypothetical protein